VAIYRIACRDLSGIWVCGSSGNKKNLLVYICIYVYNVSENKKSLLVYICMCICIYMYIIYFLSNFTCYRVFATVGQVYLQRTGPSPS